MTLGRLADSVDEVYNVASSTVYLANMYGLCWIYFLKCLSSFIFRSLLRLHTSRLWLAYHY